MDALSLRAKAALCLRVASRLSCNNPSRLQLTDLAGRFDREAKKSNCKTPGRGRTAWVRARSDASCVGSPVRYALVAFHDIADRSAC